jgi:hypothetical protein
MKIEVMLNLTLDVDKKTKQSPLSVFNLAITFLGNGTICIISLSDSTHQPMPVMPMHNH